MTLAIDILLENRYRIDRLLAEGGMGAIYQGFDNKLQTNVAIKENVFQTPESVRQFEQEALILARLRHPNLPRVSDHFIHEEQQYLVMDFIEGQDLWQIITLQHHPLTEGQAINYIKQVGEAVSYLHEQHPPIIHRDIKPQNIKITPQGLAVLVDFGIAKMAEVGEHTILGAQWDTPGFSPPEQHNHKGTTPQSDIYALGATLYALLIGQRPPDSVSVLVSGVTIESMHLLNPDLSEQVSQAIVHAMEPRQKQRPATVRAWLFELTGEAPMMPSRDEPTTLSPHDISEPIVTVPPMPTAPSEMVPPRRMDTIPPTFPFVSRITPPISMSTSLSEMVPPRWFKALRSTVAPTTTPPIVTETPFSSWGFWSLSMVAFTLISVLSMGVTCFVLGTSGDNPDDISGGEVVATQISARETVTAEALAVKYPFKIFLPLIVKAFPRK